VGSERGRSSALESRRSSVTLPYVAYRAFRGPADETAPAANPILRFVRLPFRRHAASGGRLLVRDEGHLDIAPPLLSMGAIVVADIAFGVDSPGQPAIVED
jgi:hypothetical protein